MLARFSPFRRRASFAVWSALLVSSLLLALLITSLGSSQAWDEEHELYFYEPWKSSTQISTTATVSSIHFDLVGALALAAGFSVEDAAQIQLYSQLTDSGLLTGSVVYSTAQAVTFPTPPVPAETQATQWCPDPQNTPNELSMGMLGKVECPGCFTSRWGPYNIFFHFPRDRENELTAIRTWANGDAADPLIGVATYGYSSTAQFDWEGYVNIFEVTGCFITTTNTVDTAHIVGGSPQALGIYLHSLGDFWSHGECIQATEAAGLPFPAHLRAGAGDPLAPCRWLMHDTEFGPEAQFPDSTRTFSGTLALYDAIVTYAQQSNRVLYKPIPLHAEGNHLYDTLFNFVHANTAFNPQPRRDTVVALREWALTTRSTKPVYSLHTVYLPSVER